MIKTKGCVVNPKELRIGKKIEMEHTDKKWLAKLIAKQHLCEFPNYYSKGIIPMERKLTKLKKKRKK